MFKTFGVSNDIYNKFYNYAIKMRDFKNELSKIFYDHFYDILRKDFTQIDEEFNLIKQNYKNSITNSKNFQDAYRDVKAMYQSMISNNFIWSKKQETLSYLTKFYSVNLKQFLSDKESTEGLESHQSKAYKLLNYDEQKVEKIVTMRRQRMFRKCKCIEFKSLTFTNSGSINSYDNFITKYPKNILALNKYKRQTRIQRGLKGKDLKVLKTNALIKINLGREKYDLPIRLSDKYHADELLKRPEINYEILAPIDEDRPELPNDVCEQVEISIKYEGYINRQLAQAQQFSKLENKKLPKDIDYTKIEGLRLEARQKLDKVRPVSLGQASRISGVSPADIAVLLIYLK